MKYNHRVNRISRRPQSLLCLELLDSRVAPATFSIADSSLVEGDEGTSNMVFTVTRAGDLLATATIGYSTVAGTATPNVDYVPISGSLSFGPNVTTQTVNVPIIGDYDHEVDETITLQLTPGVVDRRGPGSLFTGQGNSTVGTTPLALAAADFNSDGLPDLATANRDSNSVSVLRNATTLGGSVTFSNRLDILSNGSQPHGVIAGDFNMDGKIDLVVANLASGGLWAFRNDTAPGATTFSFATGQQLVPYSYWCGTTADINRDGRVDLILGGGPNISILLNATAPGATSFSFLPEASVTNASGSANRKVVIADFNLDGNLDIASAGRFSHTVGIFLNTTPANAVAISFAPRLDLTGFSEPMFSAAGDINGDGRPDLVIANHGISSVSVVLNTTTPGAATASFATNVDYLTEAYPFGLSLADVNGDSKLDILVGNNSSNWMQTLINATSTNATTPSFLPAVYDSTSNQVPDLVGADFNGDGKIDIAVAHQNTTNVFVYVNAASFGSTASEFAPTSFVPGISTSKLAAGDFNNDGRPDVIAGTAVAAALVNNAAAGSLTPGFAVSFPGIDFDSQPWTTGDVNLDGKLDLIAGDGVYLNTTPTNAGTLTFASKSAIAFASSVDTVLRIGDFDLDGRPDVLATRRDSAVGTDFRIFRNTTLPGSATPSFAASMDFSSGNVDCVDAALADFNLDGRLDVLLSTLGDGVSASTRGLAFLLNATPVGSSALAFGITFRFATIRIPGALAVGDLNGDKRADVAFINANPASPAATIVSVYLNQTTPAATVMSLSARQDFSSAAGPIAMAEVDGDGKLDVIAIGTAGQQNRVLVLQNQTAPGAGTANFATPLEALAGSPNASLGIADFNRDGRLDLAVGQTGTSLNILLNRSYAMLRSTATGTIIDNDPAPDNVPPGVSAVYFDSTVWTAAFRTALGNTSGFPAQTGGSQLASLPWSNVNQIRIKFSENVVVDQSDLAIRGINFVNYSIVGFGYDGVNFMAVWTLSGNVDTDRLIIDLDGDSATAATDLAGNKLAGNWTDSVSTFPTSGAAATDFRFRFVVAVGDVNRDGVVRNADQNPVRANLFIDAGQAGYNAFADIDGNGQTRNPDLNAVRSHLFIDPPAGPGPNRPGRGGVSGDGRNLSNGARQVAGFVSRSAQSEDRRATATRRIAPMAPPILLDEAFMEV